MDIPEPKRDYPDSDTADANSGPEVAQAKNWKLSAIPRIGYRLSLLLLAFLLGLGSGYIMWGRSDNNGTQQATAANQVTLPESYTLPASFGDIGPQLLEAGAIDYDQFVQVYERSGQPLNEDQLLILTEGSEAPIVFNRQNSYFLLNFLWAFGLANQNSLLDEDGPMAQYERVANLASTGGWSIGSKLPMEIYSSIPIITLTAAQQAILEEVAFNVYRPCCNNHTAFADCNHGMAMLGLLELMASQNATIDEMFAAAKNINAFWFPRQSTELAMYFNAQGTDFENIDARQAVSADRFSSQGFQTVHQWLSDNSLLGQISGGGNSCGV